MTLDETRVSLAREFKRLRSERDEALGRIINEPVSSEADYERRGYAFAQIRRHFEPMIRDIGSVLVQYELATQDGTMIVLHPVESSWHSSVALDRALARI